MKKRTILDNEFNYKFISTSGEQTFNENILEKSVHYKGYTVLFTFEKLRVNIKCTIDVYSNYTGVEHCKREYKYNGVDKFKKIPKVMSTEKCIEFLESINI